MICLTILAFVVGVALGAPTADLPILGIVGGQKANQEDFNYQVSLVRLGSHICGGALVAKDIVITAAHCTQGTPANYFQVRVGSQKRQSGGKLYYVQQVVSHQEFNMQHMRSDIAILKLFENVELNKNVGLIELTDQEPKANVKALVSGWGYTLEGGPLSNDLLFAEVPVIDRSYCQNRLQLFSREMICASKKTGGVDACQGDSGGPLVANKKLVGVVSWGIGCARPGEPGVYTNVAYLRSWINGIIKRLSASN